MDYGIRRKEELNVMGRHKEAKDQRQSNYNIKSAKHVKRNGKGSANSTSCNEGRHLLENVFPKYL